MVHEIFHDMYESKAGRIYWRIYVAVETHGKVLSITAILNIGVHEATNPVIEGSPVQVFNFFLLFSNKR